MCLGIPGKVVRWVDHDSITARAEIEFDGVRRVCHMACVPDASEGEFVIVHAGVAISKIDPEQARRIFAEIESLSDDDGWREESQSKGGLEDAGA